jgi:hypothetical protein
MGLRKHFRMLSLVLIALVGAGLLTVGFGLTPLSGSIFKLGPQGDFSLSSNSPVTVPQGFVSTITVTVASTNHFSGDVSTSATLTTNLATPPTIKTSVSSVSLIADATVSFSVTVTATSSTTLGSYNINVQGKTGSLTHSISVSADVTPPPPPPTPDFYLSTIPSSLTMTQGTTATATVSVTSTLGYSGKIALTTSVFPSGANSPTVSLNLTSLLLPAAGSNTTNIIVNSFNSTAGSYTISITGTSGSLVHTTYITLTVSPFTGYESINLELAYVNSPVNTTLYLRNTGTATTNLVSYYVTDSSGDDYHLASWNGPTINPNQLGIAKILIGSSCSGCVLTGSAFNFTAGNSYGITVVTAYNNRFTFTLTLSSRESLSMDSFSFGSGTNVTMYIRNTGAVSVQLVSYYVRDASGDTYSLTSFAGPTIASNTVVPVTVKIGSECPGCTLTGSPFTFTPGNSYTIIFVTSRNNQFSFTITR